MKTGSAQLLCRKTRKNINIIFSFGLSINQRYVLFEMQSEKEVFGSLPRKSSTLEIELMGRTGRIES